MTHIMMDLETWGTAPGCAIRSIGAVVFDRTTIGAEFYANIADASCRDLQLTVDVDTMVWWSKQAPAVQEIFADNPTHILQVIADFHAWFVMHKGIYLWSHGAGFDIPIWEAACRTVGVRWPWKFNNMRDTRTCFHLAKYHVKKSGNPIPHFALEDAKHQARCVQEARNLLKPLGPLA